MQREGLGLEQRQAFPPEGPLPPDTSNATKILAINTAFLGTATLVVIGRIYVRAVLRKSIGYDDYAIMSSMTLGIVVLVCFYKECHYGLGKHLVHISPAEFTGLFYWQFIHSIVVMVSTSLVKISVALFLIRLVSKRSHRIFLISMIVFLISFTLSCAGTLIFFCIPVQAAWDFSLKAGAHCFSDHTFSSLGVFNSSINIATDVIFALFPIPIVWGLQVDRGTKATLLIILSLGLFACIAALIKTVQQSQLFANPDYTYTDSYMIWNTVELSLGILASSLPSLRPLCRSALAPLSLLFAALPYSFSFSSSKRRSRRSNTPDAELVIVSSNANSKNSKARDSKRMSSKNLFLNGNGSEGKEGGNEGKGKPDMSKWGYVRQRSDEYLDLESMVRSASMSQAEKDAYSKGKKAAEENIEWQLRSFSSADSKTLGGKESPRKNTHNTGISEAGRKVLVDISEEWGDGAVLDSLARNRERAGSGGGVGDGAGWGKKGRSNTTTMAMDQGTRPPTRPWRFNPFVGGAKKEGYYGCEISSDSKIGGMEGAEGSVGKENGFDWLAPLNEVGDGREIGRADEAEKEAWTPFRRPERERELGGILRTREVKVEAFVDK